jgi:hypothetical protein
LTLSVDHLEVLVREGFGDRQAKGDRGQGDEEEDDCRCERALRPNDIAAARSIHPPKALESPPVSYKNGEPGVRLRLGVEGLASGTTCATFTAVDIDGEPKNALESSIFNIAYTGLTNPRTARTLNVRISSHRRRSCVAPRAKNGSFYDRSQ